MEKEQSNLPTKEQATSLALWKDTNAATVQLLKAGKFDALAKSVPNKVSDVLDCEPITAVLKHAGEKRVKEYVEVELIKLAGNVNVNPALNLKDHQVPTVADHLIENYKWESLEDFTLCFRRAAAGFYGEIYRIDGAVIGQWMSRYLDEKYDALEQKKKKIKDQEAKDFKDPKATYTEGFGKTVMQKYLESLGVKSEEGNSAKDNEYQRVKLQYEPKGTEYLEQQREKIKEGQRQALLKKYPDASAETIEQILESDDYKKFRK